MEERRVKTILCYGDSNTWGFNPETRDRYAHDIRWPGVLRAALGSEYSIVEEGLCGRTTVWDDPIENHMSGAEYLVPCLQTHKPIDLVIIMLGTNDLKYRFHLGAFDIARAVARLAEIVEDSRCGSDPSQKQNASSPQVLIVCPPPILEVEAFSDMFKGGAETSRRLRAEFERMCAERNLPLFCVEDVAASSPIDGIHLSREAHAAIGRAIASKVRSIIMS